MSTLASTELLQPLTSNARAAGDAILEIYQQDDLGVSIKGDESPLTEADLASHRILVDGLHTLLPDIPILSEESDLPPYAERSRWDRYFLIDPLDGTKEFISRNGEFTVNIALIENGMPVAGVVHVPVTGVTYTGYNDTEHREAQVIDRDGVPRAIKTRQQNPSSLGVVGSRRHGSDALAGMVTRLRDEFGQVEFLSMGSSLKLCLVAEGKADFYPRLAPTCEWDTAAAQAVVEAAGGCVVDDTLSALRYNRKEDILNPHFYVYGDPDADWLARIERIRTEPAD